LLYQNPQSQVKSLLIVLHYLRTLKEHRGEELTTVATGCFKAAPSTPALRNQALLVTVNTSGVRFNDSS